LPQVAAIEVSDLYFYYEPERFILKGVSLRVGKGEVVAIMGENGAGKTTLIKHFNGLLKPVKGRVEVLGIDTRHASVAQLSRYVGLVFQNPDHQLFAETVEEEILFTLRNFGYAEKEAKRRALQVLREFGLSEFRHRSPYTLSIGERKRLAIASVLAYEPEIIVLDEPTAGQDIIQKRKIADLLSMMKRDGRTIIIVTHDVEFVARRVERIVLMRGGRVIADGHVRDILTDIHKLMEARLIPPQIPWSEHLLMLRGVINENSPRALLPHELVEAILGRDRR